MLLSPLILFPGDGKLTDTESQTYHLYQADGTFTGTESQNGHLRQVLLYKYIHLSKLFPTTTSLS